MKPSETSSALKDITSQFGSDADAGPGGNRLAELGKTVQDLNRSMKAVANILEEVDRGEGTVGKIFGDEEVTTKLGEAVECLRHRENADVIRNARRFGSWYNFQRQRARGNLTVFVLDLVNTICSKWSAIEATWNAVRTTTDEMDHEHDFEQDNTAV